MNAQHIEAAAADWLTRRTSGEWSDADRVQFEAWIGNNLAHRIAYVRVESVWNEVGRLQAVNAGSARGAVPTRDASLRWIPPVSEQVDTAVQEFALEPVVSRRLLLMRALAAGLAALGVIALGLYAGGIFDSNHYETSIGRINTIALADGSNVTLNTQSRIHVAIESHERRIQLDQGEAFFKVAKDPARPFIVEVGDRRVIAVGTQFSVRRVGHDVQVTVTEGAVRLQSAHGSPSDAKILNAGAVARMREQAVAIEQHPLPETEESLSWRQGNLIFRDRPLAEAVAEFNRYNARKMVIADPSIATIRIGGSFRATSIDVFLWMLQNGFPVAVEERGGEVVITAR